MMEKVKAYLPFMLFAAYLVFILRTYDDLIRFKTSLTKYVDEKLDIIRNSDHESDGD